MLTGQHLIDGAWVGSSASFTAHPATGEGRTVCVAGPAEIDAAATAAEAAFWSYSALPRAARAAFLETIAAEIDARGEEITRIGAAETGLPEARLTGERGRTVGQLRLFASHIRDDAYLQKAHDAALPDRTPLPRPELVRTQRPVGPVAVFGASNFPLAFSTAGGDTASALAAGCPVVVKGHPAHPGTSELVAQAILAAIRAHDIHPGVFALVQGDTHDIGAALVTHPLISAVGFTGSLGAGRALFDMCAARPEPIPFFGELGSINPVFMLPAAMANRADAIAQGWAGSLTLGAGQFCTNPGVAIALQGADADTFVATAQAALAASAPQVMLTEGIAASYRAGRDAVAAHARALVASDCTDRRNAPDLFTVSARDWLAHGALAHEVFGPLGIVVLAADMDEMMAVARALKGQLTCTLQMDDADMPAATVLFPILVRKAGRILANGFPTGVEVCDAMVHGGPYPASTNFGATSVGTLAIQRFLRPVCFQDLPQDLIAGDI